VSIDDDRPLRTRGALRALIDQLLEQLRQASNTDDWTPEARARVEDELAHLMESVRREALSDRGKDT
jgi:hypothetical protein